MLSHTLLLILGLLLLVKGSDYFVNSAASLARRLGVSEFLIGLTLVAIGTSLPELATSIAACLKQQSGIIIGNVIGSNIANIGLIVGTAATIAVIKTSREMLSRDGLIMLFAAGLFYLFAWNRSINRVEAGIFLLLYTGYVLLLFGTGTWIKEKFRFKAFISSFFRFQYLSGIKNKMAARKNKLKKSLLALPV